MHLYIVTTRKQEPSLRLNGQGIHPQYKQPFVYKLCHGRGLYFAMLMGLGLSAGWCLARWGVVDGLEWHAGMETMSFLTCSKAILLISLSSTYTYMAFKNPVRLNRAKEFTALSYPKEKFKKTSISTNRQAVWSDCHTRDSSSRSTT